MRSRRNIKRICREPRENREKTARVIIGEALNSLFPGDIREHNIACAIIRLPIKRHNSYFTPGSTFRESKKPHHSSLDTKIDTYISKYLSW